MNHPLRHCLDWQHEPAVVFESDDWGACEHAPSAGEWKRQLAATPPAAWPPYFNAKLESPAEMERLADLLDSVRDAQGRPARFTAFTCLANPDFDKISTSGFTEYYDRFVDEGFPAPWQGEGVVTAWRGAMKRGVWAPEFHTRFHHTHGGDWLALLRDPGETGQTARNRFAARIYSQDRHYPEYRAMSREEIAAWVRPAVAAFERLFGFRPDAGVTSDATAEVEAVWAECGIRTFCLRNFAIPGAAPLVYHTKPWNNQDPATPMGAWNAGTDVIYLSRNIFFEPGFDPAYSFETIMDHVRQVWARNEPAVFSTHRLNYVNYRPEVAEQGLRELRRVLKRLAEVPRIRFLTTREVAALYRHGNLPSPWKTRS
ncbi:MAG TPA: hypothetical protein VNQ90_12245 [Chthoniobacteraceae bacterium]|nr:hypothetical protein [Chthoniobacteraceae bacterium]